MMLINIIQSGIIMIDYPIMAVIESSELANHVIQIRNWRIGTWASYSNYHNHTFDNTEHFRVV